MNYLDDPKPMGISLTDHLTGICACYGILAALRGRMVTGEGQLLETSLLQSIVSFAQENAANHFEESRGPQAHCFVASDGFPFVIHLSSPGKFWVGLTDAVGRPEMRDDIRFADQSPRTEHYDELHDILDDALATAPRGEWITRLREEDVPCSPLNTLEEVFLDPQVRALGMPIDLEDPGVR